jgi:hypothetical protein
MIFCDLTLMFGAGNEPNTIKEFYARIPMGVDLNAYNKGEVISMTADGIKSVGVNQWDEEWELGQIDNITGEPLPSSGYIRSKNYIPVIAGATYYCLGVFTIIYYDEKFKQADWWSVGGNRTLTIPNNVHYVKLYKTGTTYNHDICINLSNADINGQYFPHEEASEDLSFVADYFPQGMRSAGTAHDEIRFNKQSNKWEAVQRIAEVDMGSLSWSYDVTYEGFSGRFPESAPCKYEFNAICVGYPFKGSYSNVNDKESGYIYSNRIFIKDSFYTDAATFKAAMAGVTLYYELAEPIVTEIAEPFNLDYKVWNFGTEQMEATEPSSPLSAEITYGFNAIGKIKELESKQGVSKEYVDNAIATAITNELNGNF